MRIPIIPDADLVNRVYARMQSYRPDLRRETIVAILVLSLPDENPPYSETWLDVWNAYKQLEQEALSERLRLHQGASGRP